MLAAAVFSAAVAAVPAGFPPVLGETGQDELRAAISRCPVAYIPAGIIEWHGEQSACGLDALKAEALCRMAAECLGGICFPTVWLGPDASTPFDPENYPRGTVTVPPDLYIAAARGILQSAENLGFRVAVWLSGHYPGVLPEITEGFNRPGRMKVILISENQVVQGMPAGDHAGAWETSLLMVLQPQLVDLSRLPPLSPATRPATDPIPPPAVFQPLTQLYGIYATDPRVWANPEYGRRGTLAVLAGLAAEVRRAWGEPEYATTRIAPRWPPLAPSASTAASGQSATRGRAEVRYDHLLPRDWLERLRTCPIVYWPLVVGAGSAAVAASEAQGLAAKHGGMVFPPLAYAPSERTPAIAIDADAYVRIVSHVAAVLAEMGFRAVVLIPHPDLARDCLRRLQDLRPANDQGELHVLAPGEPGEALARTLRARVSWPKVGTARVLSGPWRYSGDRILADLKEQVYGPGGPPGTEPIATYECTFTLSPTEAVGRVLLDLGAVANHAEVHVNGAAPLTDHWPPYDFLLTGRVRAGANALTVIVRHRPQPTLDPFYYRSGTPRLLGPVHLHVAGSRG